MVMHVIMTNLCACCMVWGTDHHFEGHFFTQKLRKRTDSHESWSRLAHKIFKKRKEKVVGGAVYALERHKIHTV